MTSLRLIQPDERREDPHAAEKAEIKRLRKVLQEMRTCHHRPHTDPECPGCRHFREGRWAL